MVMTEKLREYERLGKYTGVVSAVRKGKDIATNELLSQLFELPPDTIREIIGMIETHPDWDDGEIAGQFFAE